ncbi:MAG: hypothetical protein ACO1SV_25445 [Fimbriimonas sp.]
MTAPSNWDGLRSLWKVFRRGLAALALGLMGAAICGYTAGILTIYVYGIGMFLGLPIGFAGGVVCSRRYAARDIAIAFVGSAAAFVLTTWVGSHLEKDSFGLALVALAVYSLVALALLWSVPRVFAWSFRYWLGTVMAVLFVVATFTAYTISVYRV